MGYHEPSAGGTRGPSPASRRNSPSPASMARDSRWARRALILANRPRAPSRARTAPCICAGRVVVCAGPWLPESARSGGRGRFCAVPAGAALTSPRTPRISRPAGSRFSFGSPWSRAAHLRVSGVPGGAGRQDRDRAARGSHRPQAMQRDVSAHEAPELSPRDRRRLSGADGPSLASVSCLYTRRRPTAISSSSPIRPSGVFLVVSACSGHGFKHSAVLANPWSGSAWKLEAPGNSPPAGHSPAPVAGWRQEGGSPPAGGGVTPNRFKSMGCACFR